MPKIIVKEVERKVKEIKKEEKPKDSPKLSLEEQLKIMQSRAPRLHIAKRDEAKLPVLERTAMAENISKVKEARREQENPESIREYVQKREYENTNKATYQPVEAQKRTYEADKKESKIPVNRQERENERTSIGRAREMPNEQREQTYVSGIKEKKKKEWI